LIGRAELPQDAKQAGDLADRRRFRGERQTRREYCAERGISVIGSRPLKVILPPRSFKCTLKVVSTPLPYRGGNTSRVIPAL